MSITDYLQRFWGWFTFAAAVAILAGAGVLIFETLPPRTIVMATGAEGGANYELGLRYQEILAKAGVKLQLQTTTGSMENLARLRDPRSGVQVGFLQGGTTTRKESPDLQSLGTIFYEPLWMFIRSDVGNNIQALRGGGFQSAPREAGGALWPLTWLNGPGSTPSSARFWTCHRSRQRKN